jgi:hypothetical protein
MIKQAVVIIILICQTWSSWSQSVPRVLFIGNSYTYYNDMPTMVSKLAGQRDTLYVDSHTVGGYSWKKHFSHPTTLQKLQNGPWNYIVLQDYSLNPVQSLDFFNQEMVPFAAKLDSVAQAKSPTRQLIYYQTWGRKNGEKNLAKQGLPTSTYYDMDTTIYNRYLQLSVLHEAWMAPVGSVWTELRNTHPELELFDPDGSHPSLAGSYAAACTFYTLITEKTPLGNPYTANLQPETATAIQEAVENMVFKNLKYWKNPITLIR